MIVWLVRLGFVSATGFVSEKGESTISNAEVALPLLGLFPLTPWLAEVCYFDDTGLGWGAGGSVFDVLKGVCLKELHLSHFWFYNVQE